MMPQELAISTDHQDNSANRGTLQEESLSARPAQKRKADRHELSLAQPHRLKQVRFGPNYQLSD